MSNRERWVVYPLIFFAFLMGARDKFFPPEQLACTAVTCKRLTIVASDGKPAVRIAATEDDAGMIAVYACRLDPALPGTLPPDPNEPRRALGHEAIQLSANKDGGFMRVMGTQIDSDLYVGHNADGRFSGYTAVDDRGEYLKPDRADSAARSSSQVWGVTRAWKRRIDRDTSTSAAGLD